MTNNTEVSIHKLQYSKSGVTMFVIATSAVLLVSSTILSGLTLGSVTAMDAPRALHNNKIKQLMPPH